MSDDKQKMKDGVGGIAHNVVAAITGAVVGAGVVAAGVVAMKNDKNREKAKEIIDEVKAKAATYMHAAEEEVDESKSKIEKTGKVAKESNQEVKKIWQK